MDKLNINFNIPQQENYVDCMVAFIDILGFDRKIRSISSKEDFFEVARLLAALKKTADAFNNTEDLGILKGLNLASISDSVVITMPYTNPIAPMVLILFIQKIQYDFIATNFKTLLRGYLTKGLVYHKDQIIFGNGYSDAYRKEQEIGHAPRVVVDPQIIKIGREIVSNYKGSEEVDHIFNHLMQDASDGYYFVDYLRPLNFQLGLSGEQQLAERNAIKVFVANCLDQYRNDEKIIRKYEWLKNYLLLTEHYFETSINGH